MFQTRPALPIDLDIVRCGGSGRETNAPPEQSEPAMTSTLPVCDMVIGVLSKCVRSRMPARLEAQSIGCTKSEG